jgi:tRNA(adenine34) deaminase
MTESEFSEDDLRWMGRALELAEHAASLDEVPVGAVLVRNGAIIGEGWNAPISNHDASHHAEIAAIRHACRAVQNYRLLNTTLYVTLEPCTMCFGALIHARIQRVVFAATEPRAGVLESQLQLPDASFYNHRVEVKGGLCADESGILLQQFFQVRRSNKSAGSH